MKRIKQCAVFNLDISIVPRDSFEVNENSIVSGGLDMPVIARQEHFQNRDHSHANRLLRCSREFPKPGVGLKHFRFHAGNTVDFPVANQAFQLDRAPDGADIRRDWRSKVRIRFRYVSLLIISTQFTKICAEFRATRK